jgi:hypothetical protein
MPTPASGQPLTRKSLWSVIIGTAVAIIIAVLMWMYLSAA